MRAGFTLIELSISLVIIGLIVGGILVGRDLIAAAETRAQISQIEKYKTAVNTFRSKFNALPGDMVPDTATAYGFTVGTGCDGSTPGSRNGDGLIQGWHGDYLYQGFGETEFFWSDLSFSNLIDTTIPNGNAPAIWCNTADPSTPITNISTYLPVGKIGRGNYVYVYENNSINWYGLSAVTGLGNNFASTPTIPVTQAKNIDQKIDDGLPTTGRVQAVYINTDATLSSAPSSPTADSTTCYDTTSNQYSGTNGGNGANCALSFQF